MDSKGYIKHMTQKYQTHTAISIIKSKPTDLTIDSYIQLLKNKIEGDGMDIDVEICSDDFEFNDETQVFEESTQAANQLTDSIDILKEIQLIDQSHKTGKKPEVAIQDSQATQLYDYRKYVNKPSVPSLGTDTPVISQTSHNIYNTHNTEYDDIIITQSLKIPIHNTTLETRNMDTHEAETETQIEITDTQLQVGVMNTEIEVTKDNSLVMCNKETETVEVMNTDTIVKDSDIQVTLKEVEVTNNKADTENVIMDSQAEVELEDYTQVLSQKTHYSQSQDEDKTFELLEQCILGRKKQDPIAVNNEEIKSKMLKINNMGKENVSFNILDKLNIIKCEINRKEGSSFDSGYRSDSQSHKLMLINSETHLYNAGESLLRYLVECKITPSNEVVVQEVSFALGEFIDKLHLEEKYPPFLEYIFKTINTLLQDIYNAESCGYDAISNKSNSITRVLLLNNSQHIIKYTIECIVDYLDDILSKVNFKSEDELEHTMVVENLSYVFSLLEKLLHRHIKQDEPTTIKNTDSNTPLSSSITDIWRRKWDPNFSGKPAEYQAKGCVAKKCAEVLKRIIMECMEGFSLISFAALQCFNCIQD